MEYSVNYFHRIYQAFFTFNISQVQFRGTRTDVGQERPTFLINVGLSCPESYLVQQCLTAPWADLLYQVLPKSDKQMSIARIGIYSRR
jgi:hypothetical protein